MGSLNIHCIENLQAKQKILSQLDPREITWLVPDIDSKSMVQKFFLKDYRLLEEGSVLRVSEFWGEILLRIHPEYQVVSRAVCLALISQWLEDWKVDWARAPGSPNQAMAFIDQLLPILGHHQGDDIIAQWWMENQSSLVRWGGWYQLCRQLWALMNEQKIIPASWIPGLLVNDLALQGPSDSSIWQKPLYVDLGSGLSAVESDVFMHLSASCEVNILRPASKWAQAYNTTLWPYDLLSGTSSQSNRFENQRDWEQMPESLRQTASTFKKYTTMLAEVKSVVGQVRNWIDEGVAASKIAIMAPDIENYWSVLKSYCLVEGIPVAKNQVTNLSSFPELAAWFSRLKINMGKISYTDLELDLYTDEEKPFEMKYQQFQSTFASILDARDLKRNPSVQHRTQSEKCPDELLGLEDFLIFALKSWNSTASEEALSQLLIQLYQNCPPKMQLKYSGWVNFLESTAAKTEKLIASADPRGIQCQNIVSSQWLEVTHVCVVGLTEIALKTKDKTGISIGEVLKLSQQAGFHLASPDVAQMEFELNWICENNYQQILLSAPMTDFSGAIEAPALIWLRSRWELGVHPDEVNDPILTRWDSIQQFQGDKISDHVLPTGNVAENLNFQTRRFEAIQQDLDRQALAPFGLKAHLSLSVTQLEKYQRCPFIFTAEKLFHLKDLPVVDLDMDRMSQGQFMHKLFERLANHFFPASEGRQKLNFGPDEIKKVVAEALDSLDLCFGDERLRSSLLRRHEELAKNFLNFERDWRDQFPETSTLRTELPIEGFWDIDQSRPTKEAKNGIPFRGSIDRVDQDKNSQYVLIDYKSSEGQVTHFGSWLRSHAYQMPLYAQAIEQGLTNMPSGTVVGGVYYVSRTLNRKKGFKISGMAEPLLLEEGKKPDRAWASDKDIKRLFTEINSQVQNHVLKMKQGHFQAQPSLEQKKNCNSCRWRSLCRSPHLN